MEAPRASILSNSAPPGPSLHRVCGWVTVLGPELHSARLPGSPVGEHSLKRTCSPKTPKAQEVALRIQLTGRYPLNTQPHLGTCLSKGHLSRGWDPPPSRSLKGWGWGAQWKGGNTPLLTRATFSEAPAFGQALMSYFNKAIQIRVTPLDPVPRKNPASRAQHAHPNAV